MIGEKGGLQGLGSVLALGDFNLGLVTHPLWAFVC